MSKQKELFEPSLEKNISPQKMPESWQESDLELLCHNIFVGLAISVTPYMKETGTKLIRNQNIKPNRFDGNSMVYIDNDFALKNKTKRVQFDDVIVVRTGANIGEACIVPKNLEGALTFTTLISRPDKNKLNSKYLSFHINSHEGRSEVNRLMAGGGKPNLNSGELKHYKILLPPLPEQKKIAQILSTWDNAIEKTEKLISAKTKLKKGLMQQLLTGKTRFPEFRDAGEWEETTVGKVGVYENGKAHEQDITESGEFIVVNSKFISTDGQVKKFTNTAFCIAEKEDILMVLSDVPNGRAIAKCFFVDSNNLYTINQRVCKITPIKIVSIFLFYVLNRNSYFLEFDDGVKQTNLKKEEVLDCPITLPRDQKEQQKIANGLSSLDKLITVQAQKLDALKKQKKGLMQKLLTGQIRVRVDAEG